MSFLSLLFKGSYDDLWKAIIRPNKDNYTDSELGPEKFCIDDKYYKRTDFSILNKRNLKLMCSFWEPYDEEREFNKLPCVVYLHGNSSSRCEALSEVKYLLPLNITVFAFDFAGCGRSEGDYISLGWYEKEDLECVIDFLRKSNKVSTIGLWGRSMGAATAIMYGSKDPSIGGLVLDSSFSSLNLLIDELVKERVSLPDFIINQTKKLVKNTVLKKANFNLDDIEPKMYAKNCFIPAYFCHGKKDTFVNLHHCKDLFQIYEGDKNIILVDGNHNSPRPRFFRNAASIFFYNTLQCSRMKEISENFSPFKNILKIEKKYIENKIENKNKILINDNNKISNISNISSIKTPSKSNDIINNEDEEEVFQKILELTKKEYEDLNSRFLSKKIEDKTIKNLNNELKDYNNLSTLQRESNIIINQDYNEVELDNEEIKDNKENKNTININKKNEYSFRDKQESCEKTIINNESPEDILDSDIKIGNHIIQKPKEISLLTKKNYFIDKSISTLSSKKGKTINSKEKINEIIKQNNSNNLFNLKKNNKFNLYNKFYRSEYKSCSINIKSLQTPFTKSKKKKNIIYDIKTNKTPLITNKNHQCLYSAYRLNSRNLKTDKQNEKKRINKSSNNFSHPNYISNLKFYQNKMKNKYNELIKLDTEYNKNSKKNYKIRRYNIEI